MGKIYRTEFSDQQLSGSLSVQDDIYINRDGRSGDDAIIYFNSTSATLQNDRGKFIVSEPFVSPGIVSTGDSQISGSLAVSGNITVGNAYTLPRVDGDAGYVLATDGSGVVDWAAGPASDDTLETVAARGVAAITKREIAVSGSLFVTGNITVGNAYTLPRVDGADGYVLTTDGAGVVDWSVGGGPGGETAEFVGYKRISGSLLVTGNVKVGNAYTLPRVDGSAGYSLTTDGSGVVTWANISGSIGYNLEKNYATKTYVDNVSGSIGNALNHEISLTKAYITAQGYLTAEVDTLQTVTDRGATTTQAINTGNSTVTGRSVTIGDITASGSLYTTGNLRVGSSTLGGKILSFGSSQVSGSLAVKGNIRSNQNIHINFDGADGDSYLYFYDGSSVTGKSLKWNDTKSRFDINAGIAATAVVGSGAGAFVGIGSAQVSGSLAVKGGIYAASKSMIGGTLASQASPGLTVHFSSTTVPASADLTSGLECHLALNNYAAATDGQSSFISFGMGATGTTYGTLLFRRTTANNSRFELWNEVANTQTKHFVIDSVQGLVGYTQAQVSGSLAVKGNVKVGNAYTLPRVDGTTDYVLTTNGSGVVSWASNTAIIAESLQVHAVKTQWDQDASGDLLDTATATGTKVGYIYLDIPSTTSRITVTGSVSFTRS